MKFVHAADLHLDSPLRGLERYEGCPADAIRAACRRALENLVRLAIEEKAQFVVLAGDQFDGDGNDYTGALFFVRQMRILHEAGIPVVAIHGNHDAQCKMTKQLTPPERFQFLPVDRPGTVHFENLGVAIHGQGFAKAAVTDNLAAAYPQPIPGAFNIGLLHTSLHFSGEHDPYARCSPADLSRKRYDYWALGHIHKRQTIEVEPGDAPVVFSGNLQGRHARETGPKGCMVVTVENGVARPEFRPLDVFRFERCEVDIAELESIDDALSAALHEIADRRSSAGLPMACRVEFTGAGAAHGALTVDRPRFLEQLRADVAEDVWLEKLVLRTRPIDTVNAPDNDVLAEIRAALEEDGLAGALRGKLADELGKLADDLDETSGDDFDPSSDAWLDQLMREATELLAQRLQGASAS